MSNSWLRRLGVRAAGEPKDRLARESLSPHAGALREGTIWRLLAEFQALALSAEDERSLTRQLALAFSESGAYRQLIVVMVSPKLDAATVVAGADTAAARGVQTHLQQHGALPAPLDDVVQTRREVVLRHIGIDPMWQAYRLEAKEAQYEARLIVPLVMMSGELVGFIDVYAAEPDAFEDREVELFGRLASAIASAIHRHRNSEKRRAVEQHSLEKLRRYEVVLRGTLEGFCIFDSDGHIVDVNAAYSRIIGYSRQELLRMTLKDIELSANPVGEQDSGSGNSTGLDRFEARHRCKDGRVIEIEGTACFTPFEGRNHFSCFYRDVTERRRIEEELRIFKSVIDSSSEAIGIADCAAGIRYINPAHQQLFGYAIDELKGKKPDVLFSEPAEQEGWFGQLSQRSQGADLICEGKHKNGRVFAIQHRGGVVLDETGGAKYYFSLMQDATTRVAAEMALRESERRLRSLFENASLGIVLEKNRTSVHINRAMQKLVGAAEDTFSDRCFCDFVAQSERSALAQRYAELSRSPQSAVSFETRLLRADLSEAVCRVSLCSVPESDGEFDYVFAIVEDLSDRRRAEDAVEAASRLESTATLAGGIAHGINNLMAVVVGNAELLRAEVELNADCAGMLADIHSSGQRAADMSQQLVAFARGGKYCPEALCFNTIIEQSLTLNALTIPAPIHLELDLDTGLDDVMADRAQMRQMLCNLCVNAVEAIEPPGKIRIATSTAIIDPQAAKEIPGIAPGNYIVVSVSDSGCGISAQVRQRLFEPFFTTKFQGRGLGLAAVWGIVRNHNGHVVVEANYPRGTTFRVYLPALAPAISAQRPSVTEALKGTETILIVDDETAFLGVTRRLLAHLGYRVLAADNGDDALSLAKKHASSLAVAIVDMVMPDMGGEQLCPLLRRECPDTKILVCSGYQLDEADKRVHALGATAFIQKPFTIEFLAAEIRRVLANSQPNA